jgi:hypothetical protein
MDSDLITLLRKETKDLERSGSLPDSKVSSLFNYDKSDKKRKSRLAELQAQTSSSRNLTGSKSSRQSRLSHARGSLVMSQIMTQEQMDLEASASNEVASIGRGYDDLSAGGPVDSEGCPLDFQLDRADSPLTNLSDISGFREDLKALDESLGSSTQIPPSSTVPPSTVTGAGADRGTLDFSLGARSGTIESSLMPVQENSPRAPDMWRFGDCATSEDATLLAPRPSSPEPSPPVVRAGTAESSPFVNLQTHGSRSSAVQSGPLPLLRVRPPRANKATKDKT